MKEEMIEREHKEIDLIQDCIKRMAHNSFMVKGWTVALVAAIIALFPKTNNNLIVLSIALLIIDITFWYLDAFFLATENKYRALYEQVRHKRESNDYSEMYCLDIKQLKDGKHCKTISAMFSKTLVCFYGTLLGMLVVCNVFLIKIEVFIAK